MFYQVDISLVSDKEMKLYTVFSMLHFFVIV